MAKPFFILILVYISTFFESATAKIKVPTTASDVCPTLGIYDCTTLKLIRFSPQCRYRFYYLRKAVMIKLLITYLQMVTVITAF
jgi:hypothetical protein